MPSGPLNVQPKGLLGFLQLKNSGVNPAALADGLAAVVDLTDWFLQTNSLDFTCARSGLTTGSDGQVAWGASTVNGVSGTAILVPQDEWWYLHHYTAFANLVAGDTLSIGVSMKNSPLQQYLLLGTMTPALAGADKQPTAMLLHQHVWVAPGTELTLTIGEITSAGTIQVNGGGRFTRLKV